MTLVLKSDTEFPAKFRGGCIALGNFDGVHLGHAELIKNAVQDAKELGVPKGVVTFFPHPVAVINPEHEFRYLLSFEERIKRLSTYNLDFIYVIEFSESYRNISAVEFVERELVRKLAPKKIITGFNFRFGKGREGDISLLRKLATKYDYEMQRITPVRCLGYQVSTSLIKKFLTYGRMILARKMLGAGLQYKADVIGVETVSVKGHNYVITKADIITDKDVAMPMSGCYFAKIALDEKEHYALVNIAQTKQMDMLLPQDIKVQKNIVVEPICLIRPAMEDVDAWKSDAYLTRDVASMNFMLKNIESIEKVYHA